MNLIEQVTSEQRLQELREKTEWMLRTRAFQAEGKVKKRSEAGICLVWPRDSGEANVAGAGQGKGKMDKHKAPAATVGPLL